VPLVSEPERLPREVLEELVRSLKADLDETSEMVTHPRGRVLDAASLRTAEELLEAARVLLAREGGRNPRELAADANLAYATMLSVIDLVKSHTDVPRVPPPR
jgi:hypothetical protein